MGKNAVIICDGQFPRKAYPRWIIRNADYIVCCDGAAAKFLANSKSIFSEERMPDAVVGDSDSISKSLLKRLGERFIHVTEQESNDQTKAFTYVMDNFKDISEIHILGAGGGREDHTIGNLSLLMEYTRIFDLKGISVDMISDYSTSFAVTDSIELECGEGRRISILSPDNSLRIKSEGLQWKTDAVVFDNWWKATLNRATEDRVRLTFSHPSMALIIMN